MLLNYHQLTVECGGGWLSSTAMEADLLSVHGQTGWSAIKGLDVIYVGDEME